jgi:hypothetical protein
VRNNEILLDWLFTLFFVNENKKIPHTRLGAEKGLRGSFSIAVLSDG